VTTDPSTPTADAPTRSTSLLSGMLSFLHQAVLVLSGTCFLFTGIYWFARRYEVEPLTRRLPGVVSTLVDPFLLPLNVGFGVVFLVSYVLIRRRMAHKGELERELEESREQLSERNRELRSSIEFLTAAREISLVLNESVEFQTILRKVLRITADLVGTKNAREITIYTADDDEEPEPRASWQDGDLLFDDPLSRRVGHRDYVRKVYRHGRKMTLAEEETFQVLLPLTADREKTGVLQIRMDLADEDTEAAHEYTRLSDNLTEYAKMIALALKTPDLYTRTIRDGLTGLYSKQHLLNQLDTQLSMTRRHDQALSVVFVDLDHFKSINDTHGHQTGDEVLKTLGQHLRENTREYTTAYRYGGEEMVLLAPRTPSGQASELAERLREGIESMEVRSTDGDPVDVTASFGVATVHGSDGLEVERVIERADQALYVSKQEGRNRVTVWNDLDQAGVTTSR